MATAAPPQDGHEGGGAGAEELRPPGPSAGATEAPAGAVAAGPLAAPAPPGGAAAPGSPQEGAGVSEALAEEMPAVQVCVRMRPLLGWERQEGHLCSAVVLKEGKRGGVTVKPREGNEESGRLRSFRFDAVIGPDCSQEDAWCLTRVEGMVDKVVAGFHATVFAYGQTGSGKTHTMEGFTYGHHNGASAPSAAAARPKVRLKSTPPEQLGLVPRAASLLFERVEAMQERARAEGRVNADTFIVKASFLQIYNEHVYDLLNPVHTAAQIEAAGRAEDHAGLRIRWDAARRQFFAENLFEYECQTADELLDHYGTGLQHKQVASTGMNVASSRSHTVLVVKLVRRRGLKLDEGQDDVDAPAAPVKEVVSKLALVDLAGSERASASNSAAGGDRNARRFHEAVNVNQSLFVLRKVIAALSKRFALLHCRARAPVSCRAGALEALALETKEASEALPPSEPLLDSWETEFRSRPRPPSALWDVADEAFLELVRCRACIRVTRVDPKEGVFTLRMKCLWSFRTKNRGEQAEVTMRGVPGIRMPGLRVTVEESRVWKDLNFQSKLSPSTNSLFWRGTTTFTMEGWMAFDLVNFPFDRHMLNLEGLEFVWRSDKDDADYHKSMKVVEFTTDTSSMLPEWRTYHALVEVRKVVDPDVQRTIPNVGNMKIPSYASKFSVLLRIERKDRFYSWQVFVVTYLITMLSCFPLGLPPDVDFLGDRLAMYASGVLTLVANKIGINEHLPNVPYQTFTDWYLLAAIVTVFVAAVATLYPYRLDFEGHLISMNATKLRRVEVVDGMSVDRDAELTFEWLDTVENVVGVLLFSVWTLVVLWAFFVKPRHRTHWETILRSSRRAGDAFGRDEKAPLRSDGGASRSDGRTPTSSREGEEEQQEQREEDQHGSSGRRASGSSAVIRDSQRATREREETVAKDRVEREARPLPEWNAEEVADFLRSLRLGHCVEKLRAEDATAEGPIDGGKLATLSEGGLVGLGLTQLQARKVCRRVRELSLGAHAGAG
ncbi:unnamed protein product [Prorocentrum cordatum]|uniref:Kinesin-like protein n=1 Tax=Prorocentrum cordatum TaxID=2364126 RepID=A0ABN9WDV2_9DINO|nr:unnamed protein product [Polarella glacialis]